MELSKPRNVAHSKEVHWFGEHRTRRASDGLGQVSVQTTLFQGLATFVFH
jgi:hypothetical protein